MDIKIPHFAVQPIILVLSLLILSSCAGGMSVISKQGIDCDPEEGEQININKRRILLYPNQHGYYVMVHGCGVRTYSFNSLESGLTTPRYAPLLRALRSNSVLNGDPVMLVVSGVLTKMGQGENARNTVIVKQIIDYSLLPDEFWQYFPESRNL